VCRIVTVRWPHEDAIMGDLVRRLNTHTGILSHSENAGRISDEGPDADGASAVGRFRLGRFDDRFDADAVVAKDVVAAAVFGHLEGFFEADQE
jgi:hypothetical protein